jgi:hypothetical protein
MRSADIESILRLLANERGVSAVTHYSREFSVTGTLRRGVD